MISLNTDTNFAECEWHLSVNENNTFLWRISPSLTLHSTAQGTEAMPSFPAAKNGLGLSRREQHHLKSHQGECLLQGRQMSILSVFTWLERLRRTFLASCRLTPSQLCWMMLVPIGDTQVAGHLLMLHCCSDTWLSLVSAGCGSISRGRLRLSPSVTTTGRCQDPHQDPTGLWHSLGPFLYL